MEATATKTSESWFAIDTKGWRRMNAGRDMAHLIREAVSNIFDQPDASFAKVSIKPGEVVIEDGSPSGIGDPRLISTVFMTDKEDSHLKRGRKGRGLKELLSAADKAVVSTVGMSVIFDKDGRREHVNTRTVGTKVTVQTELPSWNDKEEIKKAVKYLRNFIPPCDIQYTVNDKEVTSPDVYFSFDNYCQTTIVQNGVEKSEYRTTQIDLIKTDGQRWLYEMGVPIQPIKIQHSVNVHHRVPMNDNRDSANSYYLDRMTGDILDKCIGSLSDKDLRKKWVYEAIPYATTRTQEVFSRNILGHRILKSSSSIANDLIKNRGYELFDSSSLPQEIQTILKRTENDAIKLAKVILDTKERTDVTPTEEQQKFLEVMTYLSKKVLKRDIKVTLFDRDKEPSGFTILATYNKERGVLRFNIKADTNFGKPLHQKSIDLLAHELAHEYGSAHDSDEYRLGLQKVSAKLFLVALSNSEKIAKMGGKKIYQHKKGKQTSENVEKEVENV